MNGCEPASRGSRGLVRQFTASEMEDERDSRTDSLLDLPLRGDAPPAPERPATDRPEPAASPPLDPPMEVEVDRPRPVPAAVPEVRDDTPAGEPLAAPLVRRLKGGLADVALHLGVLALLAAGARLLGAGSSGATGSLLVTMLAFSFLYTIPALMVWGRTPGAAVAGLAVRNADGSTPTAPQSVRRWIAQWVTWLLAGLPGFVRLADRWSGTQTVVR